MEIIKTKRLTKHYGKTVAIDDISIQINRGDIYGFIGLNGAGKTTLIRAMLEMIKPNNGSIALFGKELNSNFKMWNEIGYLVETSRSYPNLSVYENLKVIFKLRQLDNLKVIDNIIEKLKLSKYRNIKSSSLSLGNQQRLGLAKALMHSPKLLILDEPINGLDPEGIVEVRNLLLELAQNGSTVFLSSHILEEISKIANRIGIIHEGKLIQELTMQELSSQIIKKVIVQTTDNKRAVDCLLNSNYSASLGKNQIEISNKEALDHSEQISKILVENDLPPKQIYLFTEDLEMFYLRTIKESRK